MTSSKCRREHRLSNPLGIHLAYGHWRAVYIHKDAAGRILYIGCSKNLASRTIQHRAQAPWRADIAEVVVDSIWPDADSGQARERALIQQHRPPWNRHHNPDRLSAVAS